MYFLFMFAYEQVLSVRMTSIQLTKVLWINSKSIAQKIYNYMNEIRIQLTHETIPNNRVKYCQYCSNNKEIKLK